MVPREHIHSLLRLPTVINPQDRHPWRSIKAWRNRSTVSSSSGYCRTHAEYICTTAVRTVANGVGSAVKEWREALRDTELALTFVQRPAVVSEESCFKCLPQVSSDRVAKWHSPHRTLE